MICLDDCHTYGMDTMMGTFHPPLHFYEMREDGTKIDGVTNEEVLRVLIHRLRFLNEEWQGGKFKCHENDEALNALTAALIWLEARTAERKARKVEGTHQP